METSRTDETRTTRPAAPSRHQQALMVWTAILPTLTVLQLALGDLLVKAPQYLRAPIMATLAVPIVVYVAMPRLMRLRARLILIRAQETAGAARWLRPVHRPARLCAGRVNPRAATDR